MNCGLKKNPCLYLAMCATAPLVNGSHKSSLLWLLIQPFAT
jgi:hypothetical protein